MLQIGSTINRTVIQWHVHVLSSHNVAGKHAQCKDNSDLIWSRTGWVGLVSLKQAVHGCPLLTLLSGSWWSVAMCMSKTLCACMHCTWMCCAWLNVHLKVHMYMYYSCSDYDIFYRCWYMYSCASKFSPHWHSRRRIYMYMYMYIQCATYTVRHFGILNVH